MCFSNCGKSLERIRKRKRPLVVWKRVQRNWSGLCWTGYGTARVEWERGRVVVPNRVWGPLEDRQSCTEGLYFYTGKAPKSRKNGSVWGGGRTEVLVRARVAPKDVIAVSWDGETICCVGATVTMAPEWGVKDKLAKLREEIRDGRASIASRKKHLEEAYEELENLKEQLVELRGKG